MRLPFTSALLTASILLPFVWQAPTASANQGSSYSLNLKYASATSQLENANIERGNEKKYGIRKPKPDNASIHLHVEILAEQEHSATVQARGKVKLGSRTFDVTYQGEIEKFGEGKDTYFFGPMDGVTSTKEEATEESVLGLYFNPHTNNAVLTLTAGHVGEEFGVLYFGEPNEHAKKQIEQANALHPKQNLDLPSGATLPTGSVNLYEPEAYGDEVYKHVASPIAEYLSGTTNDQTAPAPSGSTYTGYVGILDVYDLMDNPSFQVKKTRLRVFSNTANVLRYIKNYHYTNGTDNANVIQVNMFLGTTPNVSIDMATPTPAPDYKWINTWWLKFLGPVGKMLDTPVTLVANTATLFSSSSTAPTVSYSKTTDQTNGNTYQWSTTLKKFSFGNALDFPAGYDLAYSAQGNGGVTGIFRYTTFALTGFSTERAARIQYGCSNLPYYNFYIWTSRMSRTDYF